MNKKPIVAGNWKMNNDATQTTALINDLNKALEEVSVNCRVLISPTSINLTSAVALTQDSVIEVAAQNMHQAKNGAFTGEISAAMLNDVGVKSVILGHSENRQEGENDKLINLKIKSAIKEGLKVIFCIGETLKEKRNKKTNQVLARQISNGLKLINNKSNIIIAYEPVWSIGTGVIPKSEDLKKSVSFIKSKFRKKSPKVLYGGSVNANTITELKNISMIDGFLIGGASQDSKKFIDIIKKTYN